MTNPTEHPTDAELAHLSKTLRWHHGAMLALPIATGLFITAGFTIAAVGAWPAIGICVVLAVIALLQNNLFAEMAAMFPDKPGGVAVYVHEAWKRYFAPLGALASFGYWCGWALVLALTGITMGSLIQAQWLPDQTWTFSTGLADLGLPALIGAAAVVLAIVVNLIGINVAVKVNQIVGVVFVVVLLAMIVLPLFAGNWNVANLTSHVEGPWGGWKTILAWLYVGAWAIYGSEMCAAFAPEYRDTSRDTARAMTSIAGLLIGLYFLVPLATVGSIGEEAVGANPITYGVVALQDILGSGVAGVATAVLCASLFVIMVSSAADASRALMGNALEGMTLKQFGRSTAKGVPYVALLFTLVVNLLILAFVANPVAVLIAANMGYLLAITLGVAGFLLLRRDRPNWSRPIRKGKAWIPIAAVLTVFNAVILVVGATSPDLTAGGGLKEALIGVALLLLGIVFYLVRQLVQERGPLRLRETEVSAPASR
jgi:amino acid transporter